MTRTMIARAAGLTLTLALLWCWLGTGGANAVVVELHDGHVVGVSLRAGVSPASIPGVRARAVRPNLDEGNMDYNGGPVVHSSAPYVIFWDPSDEIPTPTKTLLVRYLRDAANDSGMATNDYGVVRQYSDQTGIADYVQTYSSAQVIVDHHAYPPRDTTNCPDVDVSYYPNCLTDAQLQAELTHLITAEDLPTDGLTSSSELVANAPIYFIFTPADVNICLSGSLCADSSNGFCSYHGSYAEDGNNALYVAIPLISAESDDPQLSPKGCQDDGNTAIQEPNGDGGDVAIKLMTHEDIESITDPLLDAWYDTSSGQEVADNCNAYGAPADPAQGFSPNAFTPTLGGSATPVAPATTGTLSNQLDNGDSYYVQSVWSNGDVNCELRPSAGSVAAGFTAPSVDQAAGRAISFDPSASSSSAGYSSIAWSFGDGTTSFASTATTANPAPATVSHTYATPGMYTVTLTLVDTKGNVASATHTVRVLYAPTAAFEVENPPPVAGSAMYLDDSGSSDANDGGSITSYTWHFGDGGKETLTAPSQVSHTYASPGFYTVSLTVTDNFGLRSTSSETIQVVVPPTAAFTDSPADPLSGDAVAFDGSGSSDPNSGGSIVSYSWSFGDLNDTTPGTGATPSHTYSAPGMYMVELTVTDNFGLSTTTSGQVIVTSSAGFNPPVAVFTFSPSAPAPDQAVAFDGRGSSDLNFDATISSYSWSFGDGGTGTGATPPHTYASAGSYVVALTVTDNFGLSSTSTGSVRVFAAPSAAFTFSPASPLSGHVVSFRSGGSSDPNSGGSISSYSWSFGDGATATGAAPSHTFKHPGAHTVTLTVTDSFGVSASSSRVLTVEGSPSVSGTSLSGVGHGRPRLTFLLLAGANAPNLERVVIDLPRGLSFHKRGLAKGVSVKKVTFAIKPGHRELTIKLNRSASRVRVAISGAALTVSRTLERTVGAGRVKRLMLVLTAIDSTGASTKLTLRQGV